MGASASSSNRFPEIEKYDLIEEIGHGGMATVYRARDHRLEREVAVKVIHKHLRENDEVRRRFVSEAKAVAKLRHAGIVDVYDVADQEDIERYLVVELIRGLSLRQLMEKRECLPPEVAATMVSILCDAVEHAHSHGVIHRDIKPENVLIELPRSEEVEPGSEEDLEPDDAESQTGVRRKSGHSSSARSARSRVVVKLTDFGIAKVLDAQGVTSTGQILGSPAHMAPEQIEGGAIGPATDVFALGVLMYECMVGHLPFEGRNPAQVLRRVLEGDFESADSERPAVGGRWARIIAMALANDVDVRIGSAAELGRLIDEELTALGIEDPRGDMVEYFLDEDGYRERIADQLVPVLLRRGEEEKRAGNVPIAASDFNRALALRPDDLSILKRITSLSAQTVWRERAIRGGAILAGSLFLGGAAFGLTKLARSGDGTAASATVAADTPSSRPLPLSSRDPTHPLPTSSATLDPKPDTPSPKPSAEASSSASTHVTTAPAPITKAGPSASGRVSPKPASGETKPVVFRVWPNDATVTVNGQAVGNNGKILLLPGSYTVTSSAKCCKPHQSSVTVAEDADPAIPKVVPVSLELKPATVSLTGAPPGSSMVCNAGGLNVPAGGSANVTLKSPSVSTQCTFIPLGKATTVMLIAGQPTYVPWPE